MVLPSKLSADGFQFPPPFRGGLGIGYLKFIERIKGNLGNNQAGTGAAMNMLLITLVTPLMSVVSFLLLVFLSIKCYLATSSSIQYPLRL
jgi:hypothetical protein